MLLYFSFSDLNWVIVSIIVRFMFVFPIHIYTDKENLTLKLYIYKELKGTFIKTWSTQNSQGITLVNNMYKETG